jgi:Copper resistance protein K
MKMNVLNKFLAAAIVGLISVSAIADDAARAEAKQVIELKDGSTLYVFKDGKMGMEDKFGRAMPMKEGTEMETKDGRKFKMTKDEVARMHELLNKEHRH